jgi:hypothetical protein
MPPKLFQIGTKAIGGGTSDYGMKQPMPIPVISTPGFINEGLLLHAVPQAQHCYTSINAAVPAGNTIIVIAPAANFVWWIGLLSIAVSVAGICQIFDGGVPIFNLNLLANLTFVIPMPASGLISSTAPNSLIVKNTQLVPVDITINAIGTTYRY